MNFLIIIWWHHLFDFRDHFFELCIYLKPTNNTMTTSDKFKYDPDAEPASKPAVAPKPKPDPPVLDGAFYVLVTFKKTGAKGVLESFHRFIFSDYELFNKLWIMLGLSNSSEWRKEKGIKCEYKIYRFEKISELVELTTVQERIDMDNEYKFIKAATTEYEYGLSSCRDSILKDLSKKKAAQLTPLDKLYLDGVIPK